MSFFFILLTQFLNQTDFRLDFQVVHGCRLLPELAPGGTRFVKPSRVIRCLDEHGRDWKIRVLMDGRFTGIELDPRVVLWCVRVVFHVNSGVLFVSGVPENRCSDYFLRHRYFGFMRNLFWDARVVKTIYRSDSKLATKLRNLEDDCVDSPPSSIATKRRAFPEEGRKRIDSPPELHKTKINGSGEQTCFDDDACSSSSSSSRSQQKSCAESEDSNKDSFVDDGDACSSKRQQKNSVKSEDRKEDKFDDDACSSRQQKSNVESEDRNKDSFVHALLLSFALFIIIFIKLA